MTTTTNLNLPQWAATDPVQRSDFNEAFAALDEAYSAALEAAGAAFSEENLPYVFGSFSVPSGEDTGVELVTFPFKPSAILFMNGASISMYNSKVSSCLQADHQRCQQRQRRDPLHRHCLFEREHAENSEPKQHHERQRLYMAFR